MTEAEVCTTYPRLWHMAEDGAWPAIQARGLLSTSALLDLYGVNGEDRERLEARRRPKATVLRADGLPDAILRDQGPLSESKLAACLDDGMSPADWLRLLNGQVYFWLSTRRLQKLLASRAYRGRPHTVLTIDTLSLFRSHAAAIRLSPINSGATVHRAARRGLSTFRSPADYPYRERRALAGRDGAIAELTVMGGVTDIVDHVLAVDRVNGDAEAPIWRPGNCGGSCNNARSRAAQQASEV